MVTLVIGTAILLDTLALVVWDIGTRSPRRLLDDLGTGLQARHTFARGLGRFVIGSAALVAGALAVAATVIRPIDFTIVQSWAILTALLIEQLLGPAVRHRWR